MSRSKYDIVVRETRCSARGTKFYEIIKVHSYHGLFEVGDCFANHLLHANQYGHFLDDGFRVRVIKS